MKGKGFIMQMYFDFTKDATRSSILSQLRAKVDAARERMDQVRESLSETVANASTQVQEAVETVADMVNEAVETVANDATEAADVVVETVEEEPAEQAEEPAE